MIKAHLLFLSLSGYLLLNNRLFLRFASGGRGIVPVMEVAVPAIAMLLLLLETGGSSLECMNTRRFRMLWLPYFGATILLPVLGVLYNDYPFRTVVTSLSGIRALSFVVAGCWIAKAGGATRKLAARYVFGAILIEAILAAGQYLHSHGTTLALLESQYAWDVASQGSYSDKYIITGRSIGSFINPNELGYWSAVAFWFAVLAFRGWSSALASAAALVSLFFSQSRGSMFALTGSTAFLIGYLALSGARVPRRTRDIATVAVLAGLLLLTCGITVFQDRLSGSPLLSRFGRGIEVLSAGAAADQNAEGRVMAWKQALVFYADHLAGTWGEPQYQFGHFMDNDYIRVLLQGSPVYLAALVLALGAGVSSISRMGNWGRFLALSSVVMAINAMSANPLNYSATAIVWVVLGYCIAMRWTEPSSGLLPRRRKFAYSAAAITAGMGLPAY